MKWSPVIGKRVRMVQQEINRRTVIAFSVFFIGIGLGIVGWLWLYNQPERADNLQPTLRKGLVVNEKLFSLFYSPRREAKAFKKSDAAGETRVNGDVGMDGELDTATWRLKVARSP